MEFKEYIPQGGWIKYHERVRREARRERILQVVMPPVLVAGFVVAYWVAAILELGL